MSVSDINTVLKDDFDGLTMRVRSNWYDSFEAKDNKVSIQWGKTMSDGSNLSIYFDRYDRERIRGIEDPKWSDGDLRRSIENINMKKKATSIMKSKPIVASADLLISSAIVLMNKYSITSLIVARQNKPNAAAANLVL